MTPAVASMTECQFALAKDAVSHRDWVWPKSLAVVTRAGRRGRVVALLHHGAPVLWIAWADGSYWQPSEGDWSECLPDLTDVGSGGVLLATLGSPDTMVFLADESARVWTPTAIGSGTTLAEAALSAWLAVRR